MEKFWPYGGVPNPYKVPHRTQVGVLSPTGGTNPTEGSQLTGGGGPGTMGWGGGSPTESSRPYRQFQPNITVPNPAGVSQLSMGVPSPMVEEGGGPTP